MIDDHNGGLGLLFYTSNSFSFFILHPLCSCFLGCELPLFSTPKIELSSLDCIIIILLFILRLSFPHRLLELSKQQ